MRTLGKVRYLLAVVFFAVVCAFGVYEGAFALTSFFTGFSVAEMDWNMDGQTTISELIQASDIGERPIRVNGVDCKEFYSLKDAMTISTDC